MSAPSDRAKSDRLLTGLILASMVLGVLLGLGGRSLPFLGSVIGGIAWLGVLFKQLLLVIIYPLVLASIFMGVVGLGDIRRSGAMAGKALAYFVSTTAISVVIGIVVVNVIQPGVGFGLGDPADAAAAVKSMTIGEFFLDMLKNSFKNPFQSLANGDVLGIIAFSILLGLVTTTLDEKVKQPLVGFFDGLNQAMMRLTDWVMWLAPLGILALISGVVRDQGAETLVRLGAYAATVLAGLGAHGLLVLPAVGWLAGGVPPWRLLPILSKPIAVAFSTASSAATLPVTMETVEGELGVSRRVSGFVAPLGATINMDGTALYESVAAIFIAQAYGLDLSLGQQVIVFLTATVAAVGAAGIPGAGVVTMGIVLQAVGLPVEAVGLILAVDRVLDMCRTAVNVAGDSVGTVVIQRWSPEVTNDAEATG